MQFEEHQLSHLSRSKKVLYRWIDYCQRCDQNSHTLLYAGLQKDFFYDNRAGSLEGQIVSVVTKENEFQSDLENLEAAIKSTANYQKE